MLDPTLRKVTRFGLGLAGSLIGEAQRRGRPGSHRTPDLRRRDGDEEEDREEPTSPTEPAERAAWERFVVALEKLTELQVAYALDPDELGAEQVRWAEVDLEDAVAVAGEFEVKKIRWILT